MLIHEDRIVSRELYKEDGYLQFPGFAQLRIHRIVITLFSRIAVSILIPLHVLREGLGLLLPNFFEKLPLKCLGTQIHTLLGDVKSGGVLIV